jgi:ribosomal protein S21
MTLTLLALPKPDSGFEWTKITKEMKEANAYKTLRTEWKKSRRFYEKLEAIKKRASAPAKK